MRDTYYDRAGNLRAAFDKSGNDGALRWRGWTITYQPRGRFVGWTARHPDGSRLGPYRDQADLRTALGDTVR